MTRRRGISVAAVLLTTVALTGCANEPAGNGGNGGNGEETVTLQVGVLPIANLAPLYVGMNEGFFEEENLIIEPTVQAGGAEVVASLVSGAVDLGWSATTGTVIGAARDLPLRVVAPGTIGPVDDTPSGSPVTVPGDSPIQTPQDLEGKTIAVNTLGNLLTVTMQAAFDNLGVDSSTIEFVEVPFPEMPAVLDSGQVDAAALSEPFFTAYTNTGGRLIFDSFYEASPGLPTGHWVSTESFVQENPDVLERFNRAITRANEFANENPDAAREAIGEYTQIPDELVSEILLATWATDVDVEGLQEMEEITRRYGPEGLEEVDMSTLIFP